MNRRSRGRFQLSPETLRTLSSGELRTANAGSAPDPGALPTGGCNHTSPATLTSDCELG